MYKRSHLQHSDSYHFILIKLIEVKHAETLSEGQ